MAAGDGALYVYALAEPSLPARMRVLGRALRVVEIGRVAVIAGSPPVRAGVAAEDVQEQHAMIVELASRTNALLPARYGSTLSQAALTSLILQREDDLVEALTLVRGRSQMTVRVFGAPEPAAPVGARSSGTAFLESLRARARYEPPEVEAIRRAVRRHVAAERVAPGDGGVRATIFHLVPRRSIDAYRRAASSAASALPYRVTVTGPWPPFAFAPELG
jgi:hypothetical protein